MGLKKRAREDASELIAQTVEVKKTIAEAEKITAELEQKRDALLRNLGNLVHESVPTSKNEDDNLVVRTWGEPALPNGPKK